MQESAQVALSYIKANHQSFGIDYRLFTDNDIYVHVPHGGIPKDGPSAGITLTTAIISALTKKIIPPHVAMTGEITAKGKVSPIGGLREKLTASYEYKLKTIFIPRGNKNHLNDLPSQIKDKLEIIPVDNYLQI
jgi:ATP-dependent Lon protease